jgi:putative flippase GtrA
VTQQDGVKGWRGMVRHWLKFNAVGAMGIVVQLTALVIFESGLKLNYLVATALAVEAAVLHNFIWHERWTWVERTRLTRGAVLSRLLRFNGTTGAISILGNLLFMRLFVGWFHLPYLIGNMLSIASCSLLNFIVSDQFVFQPALWTPRSKQRSENRSHRQGDG